MTCRAALRLLPVFWLAGLLWAGPTRSTVAAQEKKPGGEAKLFDASETALRAFETQDKRGTFDQLLRGDKLYNPKADLPVVELAARYYVQRVAFPAQKNDTRALHQYVIEFEAVMRRATPDKKKQDFLTALGQEMSRAFQPVLNQDLKLRTAAVLHASFMLEALGRMGQPEVGDFLAGLVKQGPNDVVKLYALKGLREYFAARRPEIRDFTGDPERLQEAQRLESVLDFLARPSPAGPDDEVAAFKFIRREAVKALAESHIPVVPLLAGKGLKAPVAYGLLRVVVGGKDGLNPPATLPERMEAALGLCQLKGNVAPQPQADLVVGLVGKTLAEFVQEYHNDQQFFRNKDSPVPPKLPWKAYAERMKLALKDLQNNLPPSGQPSAKALEKAAGPLLDVIRNGRNLDDFRALQDAVRALPRPNRNVFEGTPTPQIEIADWPPVEG